MNLTQWLETLPGRQKALADHFGITESAVSQWGANGVPVNRMAEVVAFSKGEVQIEALALAAIAAKRPVKA